MTTPTISNPPFQEGSHPWASGVPRTPPWLPRWTLLAWIIVAAGVALRLRAYLGNRSLWLDEAMLSLNIVNRDFSGLTAPLDWYQTAPVGFLFLQKILVIVWGPGEQALRLLPFVSGILVLVGTLFLVRSFLSAADGLPVLYLAAVVEPLVFYSNEVKPYSLDAALTLAVVLLTYRVVLSEGRTAAVLFPVVSVTAVWLSYPVCFAIAAASGTLILIGWMSPKRRLLRVGLVTALLSGAGFLISHLSFVSSTRAALSLAEHWSSSFAPFPPLSFTDLWWYPRHFLKFFDDPTGIEPGLGLVLALTGGVWAWKHLRLYSLILLAPFGFHLMASMLHLYPWGNRVSLYLAPLALTLVGGGLAFLREACGSRYRVLHVLVLVVLFMAPSALALRQFLSPHERQELRPVLVAVADSLEDDDFIYVYPGAEPAFRYYVETFDRFEPLRGVETRFGEWSRNDWDGYRRQLADFPRVSRFWVIFSHVRNSAGVNEELLHLYFLDQDAKRVHAIRRAGASAYLFERERLTLRDQ